MKNILIYLQKKLSIDNQAVVWLWVLRCFLFTAYQREQMGINYKGWNLIFFLPF